MPKKWGPQRKDFGGSSGFLGFGVLVSTTGLESLSLRPEKFPKDFLFGGGRVRFSSLHTFLQHESLLNPPFPRKPGRLG